MDLFFNPEANRKDGSMDEKNKELWNFKLPTKNCMVIGLELPSMSMSGACLYFDNLFLMDKMAHHVEWFRQEKTLQVKGIP